MMMTRLRIQHPLLHQPRFGNEVEPQMLQGNRVREYFRDLDAELANVKYITVNNDKPETPISQSLSQIRKGLQALLLAVSLGVTAAGGFMLKPSSQTLEQHQKLSPDYERVASVVNKARGLNQLNDPRWQGEFDTQVHVFLFRLINTLQQYPQEKLDKALLAEIQKEAQGTIDFQPELVAADTAVGFMSYLGEAGLPKNPRPDQIEKSLKSVKSGFIDNLPQYSRLNPAEKNRLVDDLRRVLSDNKNNDAYYAQDFKDLFRDYLGVVQTGVKLSDFANLDEKGTIRLFQQIANNPEKFRNLDSRPGAREAFVKYGSQMIQSLDYPNLALVWGLLLLGSAGAPAAAFLRRKDLQGLLTGSFYRELNASLLKPTLIINNESTLDIHGKSRQITLNQEIDDLTHNMAEVQTWVYENNAEVRGFLDEIFSAKSKLPKPLAFKNHFTLEVVRDVLSKRSRREKLKEPVVSHESVLEKVLYNLEAAYYTGEFIPGRLMRAAEPVEKLLAKASDKEKLQHELKRVDQLIRLAMISYTFRMFNQRQAEVELEQKQDVAKDLETRTLALYQKLEGTMNDELEGLNRELEHAETKATWAKSHLGEASYMAAESQDIVTESLPALREYRQRISEAVVNAQWATSLEELRQVRDDAGHLAPDPQLEDILRQQKLEQYLSKEKAKKDQIQQKIKAELALKAQQAKPQGKA